MQCERVAVVRYTIVPSPLEVEGEEIPEEKPVSLAIEARIVRRLVTLSDDPAEIACAPWVAAIAGTLFAREALRLGVMRRSIAPDREMWREWTRRRAEQDRIRREWRTAVGRLATTVPRAKLTQLVRRWLSDEDRSVLRLGQQVERLLDLPADSDGLDRCQQAIAALAQWVDGAAMADVAEDYLRTSRRSAEDVEIMRDELSEQYDALVAGADGELRGEAANGICVPDERFGLLDDQLYVFDGQFAADEIRALMAENMDAIRRRMTEAAVIRDETRDAGEADKPGTISDRVRALVWRRDGGRCVVCQSIVDLEFDHVIPLSRGGASTVRNVQVLCARCNERKGAQVARMGTFREKGRGARTLDLFAGDRSARVSEDD